MNSSNAYAFEQKKREPNLSVWKKKNAPKGITPSDIHHFWEILYYIRIARLTSKRKYWSKGFHWMPSHPICSVNGMTRDRLEFLWRNIHCSHATTDDFEEDSDDGLGDNEELMELQMERFQRDQDPNVSESDENLAVGEENEEVTNNADSVWNFKIRPVVDHLRTKSNEIIFILAAFHALDEMMIRFSGRSVETHRIKQANQGRLQFFCSSNEEWNCNKNRSRW